VTRLRLWPIAAVTPHLGCQLWVGKHVLELPREGDKTEFFPFLSFSEARGVTLWARVHFLESATENAAVVHTRANQLRLWDCHETQDLGGCWATMAARQYGGHQLARAIKRSLLCQWQASVC
jgi:hypothetical protein